MSKLNVLKSFKGTTKLLKKYTPEILTGLGAAGVVVTAVLAVKGTPKAIKIIEEKKEEKGEELTKKEVIKESWKCYIPATLSGVASICCIIGANKSGLKRTAVVTAAYKLTESAFMEYKDKVKEVVGEDKEKSIREEIIKDKIKKEPLISKEVYISNKGENLFFDCMSGRYFKSDMNSVQKAINMLNNRLMNEMYISLNEFYYEIGLRQNDMGDDLGWNIDDGLIEINFFTQFSEDGQTPCIAISYNIEPRYNYHKLM